MTHDYYISPINLLRVLILLYYCPTVPNLFISSQIQNKDDKANKSIHKTRLCQILHLWLQLRYEAVQTTEGWKFLFFNYVDSLPDKGHQQCLQRAWNYMQTQHSEFNNAKFQIRDKLNQLHEQFSVSPPTRECDLDLLDIKPQELAEQITLVEQNLFQMLSLKEFFMKTWQTPEKAPAVANILNNFS
eukprot:TRINITY_DN15884_c0_g1_i2.p1 TRINITY_DN15884_c0_g1~~TRINITY_DN15884_c0_g1_i2.p1  ORF type:complete len:220 (-),score=53.74 TRINITY_DN15884_c0_g1_i2:92-652(-)